jgi:transposase
MITLEQRARIRRLYFVEHWKVGTISAELGIHHDAVKLALETHRFGGGRQSERPSILDPYKPLIVETLEQHPRLRATRIFEMVRARGYAGGPVVVRRYVRTVRPVSRTEAYLRMNTLEGEQGQVDWASFGKLLVGATQRALSLFVMVLAWCRGIYARFTLDQSMESFVRGHVEAFEYFGGAPRTLLYDNLKSVVLERVGEHVRFHPRLLELAGHYHFAPRPCAPYRGNEKGKVERAIQYLRHSFFAARRFSSLDDLNRQLAAWIEEVAHARVVPGDPEQRLVRDALAQERAVLVSLPAHRFETDLVMPTASGKRPYVRFDGNDYSIPHELVKKPLTLVASEHEVRVLDGATEVARHGRSYERHRVFESPAHVQALGAHKRAARELRGRDRLRASCSHADALLGEIARRGQAVGHHTTRLGTLLDRYGAAELDAAIIVACERGAYSAEAVAHVCDQRRRARSAPMPVLATHIDPRVRELRVTPHRLDGYDALAKSDDTDDDEEAS